MTASPQTSSPGDAAPGGLAGLRLRHRAPLIGALCLNLLVGALCAFVLWQSRLDTLADARARVLNLSRLAELNVSSTLDKAGIALASASTQIERQLTARGIDQSMLWDVLDAETAQVPEILRIGVFDAQGRQVCASRVQTCLALDVSDRDYFRHLKSDTGGAMHLFGPYRNKLDGQSALVLARALRRRDGSFVGMAGAIIPVRGLQALMAVVSVGASGRAGLRRENLELLEQTPAPEGAADPLATPGSVSPQLLSAVQSNPDEGSFRALSGIDGVDRQTAYRRLPKYPLYVFVGLATTDFLASWRQTALWTAGFLLLFAATSLLIVRLIRIDMRRQDEVRALLAHVTESEDRLRALYEATPTMLHAIDLDGRLLVVSDAWLHKLGYARAEVLGRRFIEFLTEASRRYVLSEGLRALMDNQGQDELELQMLTRAGAVIDVLLSTQVEQDADGTALRVVAGLQDVTLRRRAERALEEERLHLQNIIEGTGAGTWHNKLATGQNSVNANYAAMLGYSLAEFRPLAEGPWMDLVHPADRQAVMQARQAYLDGSTAAYEAEFRLRHRDGHWIWVLSRGSVFLRDSQGKPVALSGIHLDITARRVSEDRLRASKAFLDSAGRVAGVGGWMLDLATDALEWTDETCRIHEVAAGYQPRLGEAIAFYTPEARPQIQQAVERAIASGEGWDLELSLVTAKGRAIWVRAIGEVQTEAGKAVRLVGAFQDITARRALEAELRTQNEVMTSILENLPCGLSVFDKDLHLVASNSAYRKLLDFPDALFEAPSPCFEDFIRFNAQRGEYGTGDVERTVQGIVERARAPAVPHRFERVRPNGVPVEVQGAPMPAGGFVTTYTDISERRQAERALKQRERLMRLIIDSFPGPLAHWDSEMRCTIANHAYRDWMGLDPEQMLGRTQRELLDAETYARNEPHVLAALRGQSQRVERSRVVSDGSTRHFLLHYLPDRDGDQVRGFMSAVVDVTEMKQIQLQLQDRTAQAEQANVAKGQFLANMSHEIRTPMNAILGMLKLLCNTPLSARQLDYARKTERAARALLGLLNDILDFSKVEAGKMTLDPEAFSLDEVLRDLSVILASNLGDKPVEVLFEVDPALPAQLVGDDMRLRQVLVNLAGNAVKFTARGEVVVQVRLLEKTASGCRLRFAVRDTGIGITPAQQQKIFGSFSQAEASTTRRFGGSGLGLSICQRLVGLMGGRIEVDSTPGAGSTFHFELELPVAETTAAAAHESLRALIVDDNPTARAALAAMTGSLGWTVDVASSGEEAVCMAQVQLNQGTPYQAVFVDWQMPGMDGWQTSARLRELGGTGSPPLLLMVTANGREKLAQRPPEELALLNGFLVKPVTASMLREAVAEALQGGDGAVQAPSAMRLVGMRLLVVDDNANNRQVAQELLEGEGARVTVAIDGEQGVAAVAAADPPFDVVLMDIQMPVMDGYAAAIAIRHRLGRADLPIIAMTANAMASDRDASRAAGMNDHVGKPFDLDLLVAMLLRHAGREPLNTTAAALPATAPALPAELLARARQCGVDIESALMRLGGRADVWTRAARSFVGQLAEMADTLPRLLEHGELGEAGRLMHTLKGLASMLGAAEMTALAAAAEQSLSEGCAPEDLAGLRHSALVRMDQTRADFDSLLQVQHALTPAAASPAAPADPQALAQDLGTLAGLLGEADMAATDSFASLQEKHEAHWATELQALSDAVSALDFERALIECKSLSRKLVTP